MNSASITPTQQIMLAGSPQITVVLRRSRQARRMSLRISRLKGHVTLSLPLSCPVVQAEKFILEKETWIRTHLKDLPQITELTFGSTVLYQGQILDLCLGQGRQVHQIGSELLVPGPDSMVSSRVKAFFKIQARLHLHQATDRYAAALGKPYGKITLRDTTSRWGSCSSQGNINYSWRLIMVPPDVLNYVVAHEVAHLAEMNHSARFWAVVERLYPDHSEQRVWLRKHGEDLHRYVF